LCEDTRVSKKLLSHYGISKPTLSYNDHNGEMRRPQIFEALENGPETLVGRVDWITKRWLLRQFVESEGLDWSDDWLKSLDLEFHHVDPERNLAWPTVAEGTPWTPSPEAVAAAMDQPPADTRAAVRGRAVRELAGRKVAAFLDWEVVDAEGVNPLMLPNPFDPDPAPLPDRFTHRHGGTVSIRTRSGALFSNTCKAARGSGVRGIEWGDVDAKYRHLLNSSGLPSSRIDASLEMIHRFERLETMDALTALLRF
jgi:hypothetical protein